MPRGPVQSLGNLSFLPAAGKFKELVRIGGEFITANDNKI